VHSLAVYLAFSQAQAADVIWNGHYRMRGQRFDSLSLSDTNPNAEGDATGATHRLRLQPAFRIHSKLTVFAQFDVLPHTIWGSQSTLNADPTTNAVDNFMSNIPNSNANFQATRTWAQIDTPLGIAKMGRMPVEWGSGMVYNAGNDPLDEFGDTIDRLQFQAKIGNTALMVAADSYSEGFINDSDDSYGISLAGQYSTERGNIGVLGLYRTQQSEESSFGVFTADIAGSLTNGPFEADAEVALHAGSGDLPGGLDGIDMLAFGVALDARLKLKQMNIGIATGFAQGDSDPTDKSFTAFQFNPDHNIGLMMFEEPMPILKAAGEGDDGLGRDLSIARTGYGISNALYLKPSLDYHIRPDLSLGTQLIWAFAPSLPEDEGDNSSYGIEIDASVKYTPTPNVNLSGTIGFFSPGSYYTSFVDQDKGGGFNNAALGLQFLSAIVF